MKALIGVVCLCVVAGIALGNDAPDTVLCGHSHVAPHPRDQAPAKQSYATDADAEANGGGRKRLAGGFNVTAPIRIVVNFTLLDDPAKDAGYACPDTTTVVFVEGKSYGCTQADIITAAQRAYIKTIVTKAVEPVAVELVIPDNTYSGGITIAPTLRVPNADLVIYVTARPMLTSMVYATGQNILDDQYDRPVLGHLNFVPQYVVVTGSGTAQNNLMEGVALHELIHALGFSASMFDRFRDPNGFPWGNAVQIVSSDGRDMSFLTTPTVRAWVRDHFNCSTLPGAALEDQGSTGTAGSHWEKAAFMDEVLTGSASSHWVLSGLTLAALADSGWYAVDYSKSEWLQWGDGRGCDFMLKRCSNGWPQTDGYFCMTAGTAGCTADRLAVGACAIKQYTSIPTQYQYFTNPSIGGPLVLADYCPLTYPYSDGWCTATPTGAGSAAAANEYGELYGASSRCYYSSLVQGMSVTPGSSTPRCYPTLCGSSTEVKVKVGSKWYACPSDGSTVTGVSGYSGTLSCPPPASVCKHRGENTLFPVFESITPTSGKAGTIVKIKGRYLSNNTAVTIGDACTGVTYNATDGSISCTTAASASIKNLLGMPVDVQLSQNGFDLVTPDAYKYSNSLAAWATKNAFLLFAIILSICVLACMVCVISLKVHDRHKEDKRWREEQRMRREEAAMAATVGSQSTQAVSPVAV